MSRPSPFFISGLYDASLVSGYIILFCIETTFSLSRVCNVFSDNTV